MIIGAIFFVTLGDVTVSGTLSGSTGTEIRVGTIVGNSLGNTVVWFFSGCMVLNICANLFMACNCLSPIVQGVCGPVFFIACISSFAASVDCSAADNTGMMRC